MTPRRAVLAAALLGTVSPQGGTDEPRWRYSADQLRCAVFQEAIRTRVRGESGTAAVEDRAGRDALVAMTARDSAGAILLEAWFDSLAVWRETSAGREAPDPEGVLGGRYRGRLAPSGAYQRHRVPFIPDPVAEVADLAEALDEFLPRLPGEGLPVGRSWSDSTGLNVRRMGDTRSGSIPIRRLEWKWDRRRSSRTAFDDTLAVTVEQMIRETGQLSWSDALGPVAWTRALTITARIPSTGGVRRSVTSTINQDITVSRRTELERCR